MASKQSSSDKKFWSNPYMPADVSNEYWASLSDEHRALYGVVRPLAKAGWEADMHLQSIESFLADQEQTMTSMGGRFTLEPDFQRGHVWTDEQRVRYIEALIRGIAPKTLLFNCPSWSKLSDVGGDIGQHVFECVDGLQRLTSIRRFMAGELTVFNGMTAADLRGGPFDPRRYTVKLSVYNFVWRAQLLQFYLDLNSGGTVHSDSELERVRALRDQAAPVAQS